MKKPSFKSASFGTTKYGEKAKIYTLRGAGGVVMEVSDYGGKIVRLFKADTVYFLTKNIRIGLYDFYCGRTKFLIYFSSGFNRYSAILQKHYKVLHNLL